MSRFNGTVALLGCLLLVAFVALANAIVALILMVAYNAFIVGVLGATRDISFWEAFATLILLEIIGSAFHSFTTRR